MYRKNEIKKFGNIVIHNLSTVLNILYSFNILEISYYINVISNVNK
ncbi:hypothetical protein CCAN11_440001 [Capnocytophaga canimorsus]|uniref:Uncharacterized protein n=1 Tax=Capnocytophaga canimorsus TaxID=28188 RepID=A0A0B7IMC9_9FLAO|nr:hypothetical protein CCAN11_440001 [Capnocytophaga canimorsus]